MHTFATYFTEYVINFTWHNIINSIFFYVCIIFYFYICIYKVKGGTDILNMMSSSSSSSSTTSTLSLRNDILGGSSSVIDIVSEEPSGQWPRFDLITDKKIDLVLITHFHVDHCAALPIFTEKFNPDGNQFDGKVIATHATKSIMKLSLSDAIRLQPHLNNYDDKDLQNCMDKVETIDFYQVTILLYLNFSYYIYNIFLFLNKFCTCLCCLYN